MMKFTSEKLIWKELAQGWVEDNISTLYNVYSVHREMFSTSGNIMIHMGSKFLKHFWFLLKTPMYWTSPDVLMISPDVLIMVSPQCTEPPPMHWNPPMYWTHIIQGEKNNRRTLSVKINLKRINEFSFLISVIKFLY